MPQRQVMRDDGPENMWHDLVHDGDLLNATLKTVGRWCIPWGVYQLTQRVKEASGRQRFETPAVGSWRRLDTWEENTSVWMPYTLDRGAERVAAENRTAQTDGITALSDNEMARSYFLAFAYVVARAARGRDHLSILDYGGSLGIYSLIARRSVPDIDISYTVRELPEICRVGRGLRPELIFADTDEALAPSYDLVVANGALQYFRNWRTTVTSLASRTKDWLYIARLPVLNASTSTIVGQYFARGTAPSWFLNRDEFLSETIARGLGIAEEMRFTESFVPVPGLTEVPNIRGFLFVARRDE